MKNFIITSILLLLGIFAQAHNESLVITGNVVNNQENLVITTNGTDYWEIAVHHLTKLPQVKEGDLVKATIAAIDGDILVASELHRVVPYTPPPAPIYASPVVGKSITSKATLRVRLDGSEVWINKTMYPIKEVHKMSDGSTRYYFNKNQFIWVHDQGFGVYKSCERQIFYQAQK